MDKKKSGRDKKPKISRPGPPKKAEESSEEIVANDTKTTKDSNDTKTSKDTKDTKTSKDTKDTKTSKDTKDTKTSKDKKPAENKESSTPSTPVAKSKIKKAVDSSPEAVEKRKKEEQQHMNLIKLTDTVIEILRDGSKPKKRRGGGRPVENTNIKHSLAYRNMLDRATFRLSTQHELFVKLYKENRKDILASLKDEIIDGENGEVILRPYMDWMCNKSVEIYFGEGMGDLAKMNLRLKLSIAYNEAVKLRDEIDEIKYKNLNARETARGEFSYRYSEILHTQLLIVILDALEEDHKDRDTLKEMLTAFESRSYLGKESDEDSDSEDNNGMSHALSKITGQKVGSKDTSKIMKTLTQDNSIIKSMGEIFGDIQKMQAENPAADPADGIEKAMHSMAPRLASFATKMGETMKQVNGIGEESSSDSSDSSDDSVSDVSSD